MKPSMSPETIIRMMPMALRMATPAMRVIPQRKSALHQFGLSFRVGFFGSFGGKLERDLLKPHINDAW
jgi:hypothetical protein